MLPTIAIVDDDPHDLDLLIEAFKRTDFVGDISTFHDGTAYLEHLSEAPSPPTLTLLDLHMPGDDGFEVVQRIRAAKMYCPVVVLTSSWKQSDIDDAYRLGANAVVLKPVVLG